MRTERNSVCRFCVGSCGVLVEVADGRAVAVRGDRQHPLSQGYACIKGLQGAYAQNAPDRILRPLKRVDGRLVEIPLDQALDEIAARIGEIIAEDGPRSVATFKGTQAYLNAPLVAAISGWMAAIGSPSLFTTMTIDQSAKYVAVERLGMWRGGRHHFLESDAVMIVGANPLVSIGVQGMVTFNMTKQFKAAKARGMKLIVVDPRRSETAAIADLHLPIRAGEDAVLLAGMVREVLAQGWHDATFCTGHVADLAALRDAVEPYDLARVAERAGLDQAAIAEATRIFARDAARGFVTTGTGPSMAPHSNLSEHLAETLNVICGRFNRAGEVARGAGLLQPREMVAEVLPPGRGWEHGERSRVRGFGTLFGEMMTATLPEEILAPGPGRIRALIASAGNPAAAIPDQDSAIAALRALDLLVAVEPYMTHTARIADYVLPPTLQYERDDILFGPMLESFNPEPFQQYIPAITLPPPGAEVIDDWRVFWELARRLGRTLEIAGQPLDMESTPGTEEVIRLLTAGGPVSIDDLRQAPLGLFYDEGTIVAPGRQDPALRFRTAPHDVVAELRALSAAPVMPAAETSYLLIPRRMREVLNSLGLNWPDSRARAPYNAAWLHPAEMHRLGFASGDPIRIESAQGGIDAIVVADDTLRRDAVAMTHCWGDLPGSDSPFETVGASIARLINLTEPCEPINAMPLMSAIPVRIVRRTAGRGCA